MKKKLFAALTLTLILLAAPGLLPAKMTKGPMFGNSSSTSYEGACKSAVVQCAFQSVTGIKKVNMVKKNKGRSANVSVTFTNMSGMGMSGAISFDDGLWLSFSGPMMAASSSRLMGQVPVTGAARLSGDVTYDLNAKTFAGSGEVVTFDGSMDVKGLMKSSNDRAMIKIWINPSSAVYSMFSNNSSVQKTPNLLRVKLPAIQMRRK